MGKFERLFRKSRAEKQLDAELQFHIEKKTAENISAGMTPEEALRRARIEFGAIEGVKEDCRESRRANIAETSLQDARYGLRMLRKNAGFTAVAAMTLALGIGANTAIFSVIQAVLLRPLPYDHPENLVQVFSNYPPVFPRLSISPGDFQDWQRQTKSLSEMAAYAEIIAGFNLTDGSEPDRVEGSYATSNLFPLLGVRPAAGRTFAPEEDKPGSAPEALLSHRFWVSRFGADPSVVGRTITLDGKGYTVIGVLPASFQLERRPDVWLSMGEYPDDLSEHVHHGFDTVGRLKPGVTLAQAQAEFVNLNQQEAKAYPDSHKNFGVEVRALEDPSAGKLRGTLLVLLGAVGLVLLIACANIVNLLLARNAAREREIALRTALGASPRRLIRQLVTESLVLSFFGGAVGLLLAAGGIRVLGALVPAGLAIVRETSLNGSVLAFTAVVCLGAGILCGLLPALQASRTNLNNVLKQGSKSTSAPGSHKVHNALVISEIALALVPLVGAGLLLKSLRQTLEVAPGFRIQRVLTMQISQPSISREDYLKLTTEQQITLGNKQALEFEQVAEQVRALPGVEDAGGIDDLPLGNELRQASRFVIEGQPIPDAGVRPVAQTRTVSLTYFSALQIPLVQGRAFLQNDWPLQNIVINDFMARRFWPQGDALGKRINLCSLDPKPCWFSIIGIVGNVHQFGLDTAQTYDVYFPGGWTPYLVIRTASDPLEIAAAAAGIVHKVMPTLPVTQVLTMDTLVADSVSARRFSAVLTGVFAGLALLLAGVGIYGVMSYSVGRRTNEIGIRMALGAQPGSVLGMIMGRGARLALAGVALGLAGALALTRYLASLLFGVQPKDPVTYGAVAALVIVVTLAACYVPARRAMRVDPMVALRYE